MSDTEDSSWRVAYYCIQPGDKIRITKGEYEGKRGEVYKLIGVTGKHVAVKIENEEGNPVILSTHLEPDMPKDEAHHRGQRRLMRKIADKQKQIRHHQTRIEQKLDEVNEIMKLYFKMPEEFEEHTLVVLDNKLLDNKRKHDSMDE